MDLVATVFNDVELQRVAIVVVPHFVRTNAVKGGERARGQEEVNRGRRRPHALRRVHGELGSEHFSIEAAFGMGRETERFNDGAGRPGLRGLRALALGPIRTHPPELSHSSPRAAGTSVGHRPIAHGQLGSFAGQLQLVRGGPASTPHAQVEKPVSVAQSLGSRCLLTRRISKGGSYFWSILPPAGDGSFHAASLDPWRINVRRKRSISISANPPRDGGSPPRFRKSAPTAS